MSENAPNHISDNQLWNWLQEERAPGLEIAFDDNNIPVPLTVAINLNILYELKSMNNLLQLIARRLEDG